MELRSAQDKSTVLGFVAAAAMWIALLGPAWAYIPATPTTPAAYMKFRRLCRTQRGPVDRRAASTLSIAGADRMGSVRRCRVR